MEEPHHEGDWCKDQAIEMPRVKWKTVIAALKGACMDLSDDKCTAETPCEYFLLAKQIEEAMGYHIYAVIK
jgi:hypothetical protein